MTPLTWETSEVHQNRSTSSIKDLLTLNSYAIIGSSKKIYLYFWEIPSSTLLVVIVKLFFLRTTYTNLLDFLRVIIPIIIQSSELDLRPSCILFVSILLLVLSPKLIKVNTHPRKSLLKFETR